jgi:hypothetical protein
MSATLKHLIIKKIEFQTQRLLALFNSVGQHAYEGQGILDYCCTHVHMTKCRLGRLSFMKFKRNLDYK